MTDQEEQTQYVPSWKNKPSMYHRQIKEVADIEKSYQWLEKAEENGCTAEALTMAAQEQTLSTRSIEAKISCTSQDCRCLPRKEFPLRQMLTWNTI